MNRRGFLKAALGAVTLAAAPLPFVRSIEPFVEPDFSAIGSAYAKHLAQSMIETKETIAANILSAYTHRTYALAFAVTNDEVSHG